MKPFLRLNAIFSKCVWMHFLMEMRLNAFANENASQMKPLLRPDAFDIKSKNFEKYMTIHLRFELSRHH